ncbi:MULTISPECIES: hypothetical protein [Pseudomonas]|uniref:hypothetical protein n=1 Tax=Pseudomonas TaxID=286 RepID=UPI0007099363|nr:MULTISPECIES: hypothetical protein [Pseudomonas]KQW19860.1 hypothetical protein ASC85_08410 [Pseudomonas sp. Root401]PWD02050.1 hypothetical protein CX658_19045 [Pseudomonas amygdali pv. lachrymans]WHS57446.1 hypothetical protein QLH64_30985 [Pseudomonas brassicacearum]WNZ87472.1 hypothetical protein QOM10_29760 [Pseudomonas sp. P108]
MAKQRTVLHDQLEARAKWEKYLISGAVEEGELALHFAECAGYGANEKTALIKNVRELSKAFDEGRSNAEADWAISLQESGRGLNFWSLNFNLPKLGEIYRGRIVHGDADMVYQTVLINGDEVVIAHRISELSSLESNTFAHNSLEVHIQYIASGLAVGKLVQPS